jgi:hypothetical protein
MRLIHIAPTNLIAHVDKYFNKGLNMVLTHLVLNNPAYREAMAKLKGIKFLDNSYFELGYCMRPQEMIEAAKLVHATHLICPDGTTEGAELFKEHGYKVICIPKWASQFEEFMRDPAIDIVGVSEEHFAYRHSPGARYELFRDHLTDDMPEKKIHLLGGTDSLWELGMLKPFDKHIYSWDSSMAIWQGHLGVDVERMKRKDTTSVDFDEEVQWNFQMDWNISFLERITR